MILTVGIRHPAPGDILENWPGANRSARSGVTGTDSVRDTSSRPSRDAPGITPGAFFVAGRPPVGYRHRFRMGNGAMPKRRGRGEGGVEQLPSGRWRAVVVLKTDPATGRRDRISKTFAAKADALDQTGYLSSFVDRECAELPRNVGTAGMPPTRAIQATSPRSPHGFGYLYFWILSGFRTHG